MASVINHSDTPRSPGPATRRRGRLQLLLILLLKVNDKGLPEPGLRALASAIDLGARGKVALEGSTLLSWDEHA